MKTLKRSAVLLSALASFMVLSAGAQAAPGDQGKGRGGCVAGEFYGNTSNPRPSGNGVLPSQSPGPFVNTGANEPPRNDRVRGLSIGEAIQIGHELGLDTNETFEAYALATGC